MNDFACSRAYLVACNEANDLKKKFVRQCRQKRVVLLAITIAVILSLIGVASNCFLGFFAESSPASIQNQGSLIKGSLRAALIDPLFSSSPNSAFVNSINKTLRSVGFSIDVYQGNVVTVDFLKNLPSGYKLVILRMHSALSKSGDLYLFTAEPYSASKYVQERYFRLVKEAYATDNSTPVFAVNWGFVKKCMSGKFDGALVMVMGCEGASDLQLVKEFVNQGAVGCVGWNGPVLLSHSDMAILHLVEMIYLHKMPLEEAVSETNENVGKDPVWDSILECYIP